MGASDSKRTGALVPLTTDATLEGIRVLVVDDDADVRGFLRAVLEDRKATVEVASSVAEAVAAFTAKKPDVIVSDIGMPEESGHSLIRRLRALEIRGVPRVPAIALTGHNRAEDRLDAIRAGFQIHVSKPVESEEFLTIVATFAGRLST